jgi:SsrA-binding protein
MGKGKGDLVSNRKAFHDYEVIETFEAGIQLKGTEIKSLRDNGGTLQQAYVKLLKGELWLIGANIAHYKYGNIHNHEEQRDRKLLVHKRELKQMGVATKEKGLTLIPLGMYLKKGWVKVKVAIAKGKKAADKRNVLKERDELKRMQRAMRNV